MPKIAAPVEIKNTDCSENATTIIPIAIIKLLARMTLEESIDFNRYPAANRDTIVAPSVELINADDVNGSIALSSQKIMKWPMNRKLPMLQTAKCAIAK